MGFSLIIGVDVYIFKSWSVEISTSISSFCLSCLILSRKSFFDGVPWSKLISCGSSSSSILGLDGLFFAIECEANVNKARSCVDKFDDDGLDLSLRT